MNIRNIRKYEIKFFTSQTKLKSINNDWAIKNIQDISLKHSGVVTIFLKKVIVLIKYLKRQV